MENGGKCSTIFLWWKMEFERYMMDNIKIRPSDVSDPLKKRYH